MYDLLEDPNVHVFRRVVLMADTPYVSRRKVATGKEDIKSAKIAKVALPANIAGWEMD